MALDRSTFDRVTRLFDRGVADPTRWHEALNLLGDAFGSSGATLFAPDPTAVRPLLVASVDAAPSAAEFGRHWIGRDAWIDAARRRGSFQAAGSVDVGRSVLTVGELHRTAYHSDFLRRHDIEDVLALKITDDAHRDVPATHLSLYRPAWGPFFDETDKAGLMALWPHLHRAVNAWALVDAAVPAGSVQAQAIDAMPQPAWILRDDASIDYANRAARALAREPAAGVVSRHGRLQALGDLDEPGLRASLRPVACEGGLRRVTVVMGGERPRQALLHIVPLTESPAFA